jgi:hypothetical protein
MAMANGRRWSEVKERIRQGQSVVAQVSRSPKLHKGVLYTLSRKISNAQMTAQADGFSPFASMHDSQRVKRLYFQDQKNI